MSRTSALGVLIEGAIAGLAGALAQDLFFALTKKITPATKHVFSPPEPEQQEERSTETVARRFVEGLAKRAPLQNKSSAARLVHYAYGSAWGEAYGVLAASSPKLRTLPGGLAFGFGVWMLSDNLILPVFRLSAWPPAYPLRSHAYALAAHLVYGGAVCLAFNALDRNQRSMVALLGGAWLARRIPRAFRPTARRALVSGVATALRARDVMAAVRA